MTTVLLLLCLLILAGAAYWPLYQEKQRTLIGRHERTGTSGKFAKLSQGVTRYQWYGPVRGPVVVAIHGLLTPGRVWDALAQELGGLGYRVLAYDLYGRGLSDAPTGPQDELFFLRQLDDLLDDQGVTDEITLMGYSMGGAISVAFAAAHPHRVKRVVLVAPAGIALNEDKFTRACRMLPLIGDWAFGTFGPWRMLSGQELLTDDPDQMEWAQMIKEQCNRQGFLPAILSSRRNMLTAVQEAEHRKISREDIPLIAIWAEADEIIPASAIGQLAKWNRVALQSTIAGAGHHLLMTHADETALELTGLLTGDEKD